MARDVNHEYDAVADTVTQTVRYRRVTPELCPERARRGTGEGLCDRPLDENGYCDRPAAHLG